MIFHTSADTLYYEKFYNLFSSSIKKHYTDAKLSLNYVEKDKKLDIPDTIISYDNISINEICKTYRVSDRSALGYYALSRWLSIPILGDHVAVCDIDLLAINKIDNLIIEQMLNKNQVVNVTRIKPNGQEGGMMIMILHKDICQEIKNYANSLLESTTLEWSTDVKIRNFLYENYSVGNILNMHQLTKRTDYSQRDKIKDWFVFSKGNIDQKLNRLQLI
jgi:hypothetical protein